MNIRHRLRVLITRSWLRRHREADVERELRSHLDLEAEEQLDAGLPAEEARYAARRALGNAALVKEEVRETWGWSWEERLLQDVHYTLRKLRKNPGFAALAIITLALGTGANTATFTVIDSVLIRPLPFCDADRLVSIRKM
jgi:putative ABC transport system permease protein